MESRQPDRERKLLRRCGLLVGVTLLVATGCATSLSDSEWTWCQANETAVWFAFDRLHGYGARVDWYFAGNSTVRTNADTIEACKAAYSGR